MNIPNIQHPILQITIPSNGKIITARPFIVKEEKLLLMAANSKDTNEIINTTKQVISNCVIDWNGCDLDTLPFFDINYIFITLRAKSISENISLDFRCNTMTDGTKCNHVTSVPLDLTKATLDRPLPSTKIILSEDSAVNMRYPTYKQMKIIENFDEITRAIHSVAVCIDYIVNKDTVYSRKDYTNEDFANFVENLTQGQYDLIKAWIDQTPQVAVKAQFRCAKCFHDHVIEYKDFDRFF